MPLRVFTIFSLIVFLIGLVSSQQILAQVKTQPSDDVVRTKTELVQTDVTVVDKRGRFVDGLRAEDFEVRVDSKLQSLSFFEQVRTGSVDEEKQVSAARTGDGDPKVKTPAPVGDRERIIFFFVDDVHLTGDSCLLGNHEPWSTCSVSLSMIAVDSIASGKDSISRGK